MGKPIELDLEGNLRLGPSGVVATRSRIQVAFDSDDTAGAALEVTANPSGKAVALFGGFTLGQTAAGSFTLKDTNGATVASFATGVDRMTRIEANAAYAEALLTSTDYHALVNERNWAAAALAAFVGGAGSPSAGELTALYARVNQIKADVIAHNVALGTRLVRGEHKTAGDNATLTAVPAASSVATACTLLIAIAVAIKVHGTEAGVHFNADATLNGYTPGSNLLAGNATADKARIEANAIIVALKTHADASVPA